MKHFTKLLIISFIAIIIHGYQFAVSDQEIFIPYILKSANPSLFPGDLLFNQSSANLSLFYPLVGFLIKFVDIQVVFFVGYLIFQSVFFAGIYRLSKILLKNENLAYFSLLPFFLPKFIGGTATQTFDLFFGYRSIGLIFLIFYLSFLIEKKYMKCFVIAFIGILLHPLSIIPSAMFLPVIFLMNSKLKIKDGLKIICVSLFLLTLSYLVLGKSFFNSLFIKDAVWYSIIKTRDAYIFMTTWQFLGWAAFIFYPILIFLSYSRMAKDTKRPIFIIIIVSLASMFVNLIFLEILKFPSFAQFQLVRSMAPLAYIGLSLSPLFLSYKNKVLQISGFFTFLFLSLNLFYYFLIAIIIFSIGMYLIKDKKVAKPTRQTFILTCIFTTIIYLCLNFKAYFNFQEKFQFPKKEDDWISLQKWVLQNTNKSNKFLTPANKTGFRIYSNRPIVGDIKDGAVVIYNHDVALKWYERYNDTLKFYQEPIANLDTITKKYSISHIIITKKYNLPYHKVYEGSQYSIYEAN